MPNRQAARNSTCFAKGQGGKLAEGTGLEPVSPKAAVFKIVQ